MIVGIDLGTTNSAVAIWCDGRAELVPNALGDVLTPSAVSVDDQGGLLVGLAARDRQSTHPRQTAIAFKRLMGTQQSVKLGKTELRPEDLSSLVLRSLKADVEAATGEAVTEAVITVTAYFNDRQRKATRRAGELAGLSVRRLLNEPAAAALAYGLQDRAEREPFLVFDLGGGTFDVSIVEMFEGIVEVRASAGDNRLGGEDFNDCLIELVRLRLDLPPEGKVDAIVLRGGLRVAAERARRALSGAGRRIRRAARQCHPVRSAGFASASPLQQRMARVDQAGHRAVVAQPVPAPRQRHRPAAANPQRVSDPSGTPRPAPRGDVGAVAGGTNRTKPVLDRHSGNHPGFPSRFHAPWRDIVGPEVANTLTFVNRDVTSGNDLLAFDPRIAVSRALAEGDYASINLPAIEKGSPELFAALRTAAISARDRGVTATGFRAEAVGIMNDHVDAVLRNMPNALLADHARAVLKQARNARKVRWDRCIKHLFGPDPQGGLSAADYADLDRVHARMLAVPRPVPRSQSQATTFKLDPGVSRAIRQRSGRPRENVFPSR